MGEDFEKGGYSCGNNIVIKCEWIILFNFLKLFMKRKYYEKTASFRSNMNRRSTIQFN